MAEFSTALQVLGLIESKCGSRAVLSEPWRAAGAAHSSSVPCLLGVLSFEREAFLCIPIKCGVSTFQSLLVSSGNALQEAGHGSALPASSSQPLPVPPRIPSAGNPAPSCLAWETPAIPVGPGLEAEGCCSKEDTGVSGAEQGMGSAQPQEPKTCPGVH